LGRCLYSLSAASLKGRNITLDQLLEVVDTNDKQRFALSQDGSRIRASQGHSVKVALGYKPVEPPEILFHGTVDKFLASILNQGLLRGQRQHVHLSKDEATATLVGERRGKPVLLRVRALAMYKLGFKFFVSDNGVWLTDHVPPEHLEFPSSAPV